MTEFRILNPSILLRLSVFLALAGTQVELLFIGHIEDWRQWLPVGVTGLGLILFILLEMRPFKGLKNIFYTLMALSILTGFMGIFFHLKSNFDFELEMSSGLSGWKLIKEAFTGALPALAPGGMILTGLIGLLYLEFKQTT